LFVVKTAAHDRGAASRQLCSRHEPSQTSDV
jgi:hypothetical protein